MSVGIRLHRLFCPLLLASIIGLAAAVSGYAEELSESGIADIAPAVELEVPVQIQAQQSLESIWRELKALLGVAELGTLAQRMESLQQARDQLGIASLEEYSLELLDYARQRAAIDGAVRISFIVKWAIALSPTSAITAFKALPILHSIDRPGLGQVFWLGLRNLSNDRELILSIFLQSIYPLLWAMTFALFASLAACIIFNLSMIMRRAGLLMPIAWRGILTPILVLALIAAAIPFGPLWCVIAWSCVTAFFIPSGRWLILMAAATLCLWASLIPIRENLKVRAAEPGIRTVLNVAAGTYSVQDIENLKVLLRRRPSEPSAHFTMGRLLMRQGDLDGAWQAFNQAALNWNSVPTYGALSRVQAQTKAELGSVLFLKGDFTQADRLYAEAESSGLASPEFFVNYSKIKFELLDTAASREYLSRAQRADPGLIENIKQLEDRHGLASPLSLAENNLPIRVMVAPLMDIAPQASERFKYLAPKLMPGVSPEALYIAAIALLVLFCLPAKNSDRLKRLRHFPTAPWLRHFLRLIPGGAWVAAQRPASGFAIVTILIFAALPIFAWPIDAELVLGYLPWIGSYYVAFIVLAACAVGYVGYFFVEED